MMLYIFRTRMGEMENTGHSLKSSY